MPKELTTIDFKEEQPSDIALQILYQWWAGECLKQPVELLIINYKQFVELGHAKIQELQEFLVAHGAVDYVRIVGDHNSPEGHVLTSAVGQ